MKKLIEAFRRRNLRRRHRYIIERIIISDSILRDIARELKELGWDDSAKKIGDARFDLATAQAIAEAKSVCHPDTEFKWPRA